MEGLTLEFVARVPFLLFSHASVDIVTVYPDAAASSLLYPGGLFFTNEQLTQQSFPLPNFRFHLLRRILFVQIVLLKFLV